MGTHKWSNGSLKVHRDIFCLTCLFALKLAISVSEHFDQATYKAERAALMIGMCVGVFLKLT